MKTKNFFSGLLFIATLAIVISSCRKKDERDSDTGAASDNSLAEITFNDVNNIADQASTGNLTSYLSTYDSDQKSVLSTCATITHDTISTPRLLTIDFGSSNCLCADQRTRRGKILVSYTGRYRDSASTHNITFDNYFVNDNQVLGSKQVTNNGRNAAGNLVYSIQVNGQIIKASGGTITWTSTRQREWIAGEGTPQWSDDSYLITGSASGTNAAGNSFVAIITSPLRKNIGCRFMVSGQMSLSPSGKATRYIDFGNGVCDNQVTVTINGNVYTFNLQ